MEKTEKLSPREWIENVWYHYKWPIIIFGLLAIFLIISCVQLFSNKEPDVDVLHVGPMYISGTVAENIDATLKQLSEDYNGDGETVINILDITVNKYGTDESNTVNYDHNNQGMQRFQTEIRAGDAYIFFLDKEFFDVCMEENLLTPLTDVIDDIDMPENTVEGCGIPLSELDAYELPGICDIPDTAILCLRRSPAYDDIAYGRTEEAWDNNRKTFVKLVKYQSGNQE